MNKRFLAGMSVLLLVSILFGGSGPALAASEVFPVDHEFYPYYPSLIQWNKSDVDFTPPKVCRGCHPRQYQEWSTSVHAMAFLDPVYQGELNEGFKAVGHDVTRQCEGCHSPVGMVTGEVKGPGLKGLSDIALAGVSCDVCHSISGVTHWQTPSHEPENGSMILTPGVETVQGPKRVKRGPFPPSERCGMGFHACEESPLHLQAELCASCHQVYHYDDHFPLEATYLEWKHGPYAQKGILCQDCHMVETETFLRSAETFQKPVRQEYHHYFVAANYLLYSLGELQAQKAGDAQLAASFRERYAMAVERLQAAAELEVTPLYREGQIAEIKVRVKNVRAGHNLPTSLTNVRQMWLEIVARDDAGQVLLASGGLDGKGQLPAETRTFNSEGMGSDFHFAIDPWEVTAFSRHDTIPPRGYRDVYYGVHLPADVKAITVEARLRYRQADQLVAEKLLGAVPADMDLQAIYGLEQVPQLPVVDMAVNKSSFSAKEK